MYGNLDKPTYPPNLKTTLITNNNGLLVFKIHAYYSAECSLKERNGSELNIFRSADNQTPFFHPEISSDLHRSQRVPGRRLGGGEAVPFATPRGDAYDLITQRSYLQHFNTKPD